MDPSELSELKRLLSQPDPLEVVAEAVKHTGVWRSWTFERQIWYLRKRRDVTQAELSRRSGVSQHRISRIEDGEDLKFSTLRALCLALGYAPLVIPDSLNLAGKPRIVCPDINDAYR